MARNVLEVKQLMDSAMSIASLRMPASEVVEVLTTLDEISLSAEQATKLQLLIPNEDQIKLLEENRAVAEELSKEEQYLL